MPRGTVKFFDVGRGFGFVRPDDGGEDIFVHVSAVEAAGLSAIGEGDVLEFDVENRNGRFTATELDLIEPARLRPAGSDADLARGVVRWFNTAKGFGFIQPEAGGEDVFVHVSAVERAGLPPLTEGQPVVFRAERDRRTGKVAAALLRAA